MLTAEQPEEGIYFGDAMPEAEYHAAHALSHSGMKALAVSSLQYHHQFIEKAADESSDQARFGTLVHCRLLEPKRFANDYAVPPSLDAHPGALVTMEDLKAWLAARNLKTSAKAKAELIERVQTHAAEIGEEVIVWDAVKKAHEKANQGKRPISEGEAERVRTIAGVIASDPTASKLLTGGYPEVSFFVRDPISDVLYKARMDYVKSGATIDVKTFGRYRGESPKKAINRAFWYEGYHRQGVFYHRVRDLARRKLADGEIRVHGDVPPDWLAEFAEADDHAFAFLFIEAEAPHHLDLVRLKRTSLFGELRAYWGEAERWIDKRIAEYLDAIDTFGDRPWREELTDRTLDDLDLPQLSYAKEAVA